MNRGQLINITSKHYRKLKKNLNQVVPGLDPETIHQFRVEYKKLRAFLRMIPGQPGANNEIMVSKELKKAYNISGSIRDLQLQQLRIKEAVKKEPKKPQSYLNLLQKEIEKLKPELSEIISGKPVNDSKKKTDHSIDTDFQFSVFLQYVQKKWAAIRAIILSGNFSDDNIHTIRKILKDLFYNLKTYEDGRKEILAMSIWKGKNEVWFNALLDELGNFQDKYTSVALLKSYWIISLNNSNQALLNKLKKTWIREKTSMKQILVKKIKTGMVPDTL